jgi:hypothetical protein
MKLIGSQMIVNENKYRDIFKTSEDTLNYLNFVLCCFKMCIVRVCFRFIYSSLEPILSPLFVS